ncbi:alkaline phosphatase [Thalassotalea crassostreae]|uniref:alkaline phosphatase n=1 Tax=Thalassotalea crassostreae TaxID=1763536 RepID=UPI000A578FC5|nr:alkaline phosphatase [Thalassotalea crassostreae]
MNKLISPILAVLTLAVITTSCSTNTNLSSANKSTELPKNIIMVVADGMGPAFPTAYRYYHDDPMTPAVEHTIFDDIYVGSSSTYPSSKGYISDSLTSGAALAGGDKTPLLFVTDSAASATALASGIKTYNGAIGVDSNQQAHLTVLEWAKIKGKKTGLAVTSQIVHATPASYLAKNESRRNYNAIADDFFDLRVDGQFKADVMLGGGNKYFKRDDRDLVAEFQQSGFQYIDRYEQLETLDKDKPVLGLFADVALTPQIDSKQPNRLKTLTTAAIKQLENDKGFFLLLEASQVDWGAHSNDIAYAMGEMDDLAATMTMLKSYVDANPDTLVILTADHNTGGFSIGSEGKYEWRPNFIRNIKTSPEKLASLYANGKTTAAQIEQQLGFILSKSELQHFNTIKMMEKQNAKSKSYTAKQETKELTKAVYKHILDIINSKSHSGWTTKGHTGVDVPVYAFGLGKEAFYGFSDNTEIAYKVFHLLGKD